MRDWDKIIVMISICESLLMAAIAQSFPKLRAHLLGQVMFLTGISTAAVGLLWLAVAP